MGATDPNFADKTIWTGDNLDILRGMNSECVDLIYLDPPFNSNQNYAAPVGSKAAGAAFKDTWHLSDLDVAWMGLIADERPATAHVLRTAGVSHGKGMQSYLTMMAVRLLEMHRVLKDTGSIYLHCDPTASHYLKLLMDAVFGGANFRNEVVWKRTGAHSSAKRWGPNFDILLFYAKSAQYTWTRPTRAQSESYVRSHYMMKDSFFAERGPFQPSDLTAAGTRQGSSGQPWHRFDPNDKGTHWKFSIANLERLDEDQRIYWPPGGGWPRYKRYLKEVSTGYPMQATWIDIPPINSQAKERVGYPTQKPLALLERIIKASTNDGDTILDPFCGCATACVAADRLGRKRIGIDISPKAVELVNIRLQQAMGGLFHHGYVTARTDIPQRTDIEKPKPYHQNKHVLFGQQEGLCNGCKGDFPFKLYEVDHVVPKSKGGTDHLGNLQLLCGHCNKIKGDKPQEHLIAQLRELAYV